MIFYKTVKKNFLDKVVITRTSFLTSTNYLCTYTVFAGRQNYWSNLVK